MPAADILQGFAEGPAGELEDTFPSLAECEDVATPPLALPAPAAGRRQPHLIALCGARMGELFAIQGRLLIGRSREAGLRLLDERVSRHHAQVCVVSDGVLQLTDLSSSNGTYVHGQRVRQCLLQDGDRFQLGSGHTFRAAWLDAVERRFYRQMEDGALRDVLTRTYSRRYLQQRLCSELAFAQRHGTPVALLVIDVDHFKQVNDRFGHLLGDDILRQLAETMQKELRGEDVLARWGGEEFAVLAHSTTDLPALILGERIRHRVATTRFQHGLPLHVSIGIAVYPSQALPALPARDGSVGTNTLVQELIGSADEALYEAKRRGRNQVVASGQG
ncbi:MAG: GGDEF domain-containing protein [Myxococcales bacterium]|nr:GGDEF domain-containing protein [Myxococcota bacterium]MDW8281296.1 GGDEF domain-containing protein [Myxococcales bacterium]